MKAISASAYRRLSAFKTKKITDVLEHDVICCCNHILMSDCERHGALFAQKKFRVYGKVSGISVRVMNMGGALGWS